MANISEIKPSVDKSKEVKTELSTLQQQKLEKEGLCYRIRAIIDKTINDNQNLWKAYEQTRLEIKQIDDQINGTKTENKQTKTD